MLEGSNDKAVTKVLQRLDEWLRKPDSGAITTTSGSASSGTGGGATTTTTTTTTTTSASSASSTTSGTSSSTPKPLASSSSAVSTSSGGAHSTIRSSGWSELQPSTRPGRAKVQIGGRSSTPQKPPTVDLPPLPSSSAPKPKTAPGHAALQIIDKSIDDWKVFAVQLQITDERFEQLRQKLMAEAGALDPVDCIQVAQAAVHCMILSRIFREMDLKVGIFSCLTDKVGIGQCFTRLRQDLKSGSPEALRRFQGNFLGVYQSIRPGFTDRLDQRKRFESKTTDAEAESVRAIGSSWSAQLDALEGSEASFLQLTRLLQDEVGPFADALRIEYIGAATGWVAELGAALGSVKTQALDASFGDADKVAVVGQARKLVKWLMNQLNPDGQRQGVSQMMLLSLRGKQAALSQASSGKPWDGEKAMRALFFAILGRAVSIVRSVARGKTYEHHLALVLLADRLLPELVSLAEQGGTAGASSTLVHGGWSRTLTDLLDAQIVAPLKASGDAFAKGLPFADWR